MASLSPLTFPAGRVTAATFTLGDSGLLASSDSRVKLSKQRDSGFSDSVMFAEAGTYDVFVKVLSTADSGTFSDIMHWQEFTETGTFTITITGGHELALESMSLSFTPRAATVQYNAGIVNESVAVGRVMRGTLLDHVYRWEVERIVERGAKKALSGAAFANALIHNMVTYRVDYHYRIQYLGWERPKLSEHLDAISSEIGIPIVRRGIDFYPASPLNLTFRRGWGQMSQRFTGSVSEHFSRLIGWSDSVPALVFNVFIDNGTIYVIQRGYEENTLTPTNWAVRPTLTHSIRRTEWGNSATQTIVPKEIASSDATDSRTPFSGTITWGTASMTYEDGYLTQEVNGNRTVTYVYSDFVDGKRLAKRTAVDTDAGTCIVTNYTYEASGEDFFLSVEETTTYQGTDETGYVMDRTKTTHTPRGDGWFGTTVFDYYGQEVSNSVSQGAPGNRVSQYMRDAGSDAIKPSGSQRQLTVPLRGVARARQTYPVADISTLQAIADCLDDYEGKEEITLQGELVGGSHVYNYNDKIVFEGQTYYLVSNNVSRTFNTIRQSITAVRWVLS